jgi:flagellar L-ring protein precursor FlgH
MKRFVQLSALLVFFIVSSSALSDSLYSAGTFRNLTEDVNAVRVGDAVTVVIVETSSARTNTDTSVNRGVSVTGELDKDGDVVTGGLGASMERSGGGNTHRNGELRAQVTVPVVEMDPQGRMLIKGQQSVVVNGENQMISVEGWLRHEDLSSGNTVLSTRLSNAKIEYIGYGVLDKNQRPGIIYRIFSAIGLI